MAIKISSGLRDHILATGSLRAAINGMVMRIYSGAVPAGPESDATGNTLLCTISTSGLGGGLQFEASPANGLLPKASADVWSGTCGATGTASFYRLVETGDTNGSSTSAKRVQGTVGLAGADLNVVNTTFTSSEEKRIDYYVIGMLTG
jgi:hypothetical protein